MASSKEEVDEEIELDLDYILENHRGFIDLIRFFLHEEFNSSSAMLFNKNNANQNFENYIKEQGLQQHYKYKKAALTPQEIISSFEITSAQDKTIWAIRSNSGIEVELLAKIIANREVYSKLFTINYSGMPFLHHLIATKNLKLEEKKALLKSIIEVFRDHERRRDIFNAIDVTGLSLIGHAIKLQCFDAFQYILEQYKFLWEFIGGETKYLTDVDAITFYQKKCYYPTRKPDFLKPCIKQWSSIFNVSNVEESRNRFTLLLKAGVFDDLCDFPKEEQVRLLNIFFAPFKDVKLNLEQIELAEYMARRFISLNIDIDEVFEIVKEIDCSKSKMLQRLIASDMNFLKKGMIFRGYNFDEYVEKGFELHRHAVSDSLQLTKLLEHGLNPNMVNNITRDNVHLLLRYGADNLITFMEYLKNRDNKEDIYKFIKHFDLSDQRYLNAAIFFNLPIKAVKTIYEEGMPVLVNHTLQPLHVAAFYRGRKGYLEYLLQQKAYNVNCEDNEGKTALFYLFCDTLFMPNSKKIDQPLTNLQDLIYALNLLIKAGADISHNNYKLLEFAWENHEHLPLVLMELSKQKNFDINKIINESEINLFNNPWSLFHAVKFGYNVTKIPEKVLLNIFHTATHNLRESSIRRLILHYGGFQTKDDKIKQILAIKEDIILKDKNDFKLLKQLLVDSNFIVLKQMLVQGLSLNSCGYMLKIVTIEDIYGVINQGYPYPEIIVLLLLFDFDIKPIYQDPYHYKHFVDSVSKIITSCDFYIDFLFNAKEQHKICKKLLEFIDHCPKSLDLIKDGSKAFKNVCDKLNYKEDFILQKLFYEGKEDKKHLLDLLNVVDKKIHSTEKHVKSNVEYPIAEQFSISERAML